MAEPAAPRLLVVDDDASVRLSLALLLKQHGYASTGAATPAEALELVAAQPFDLVLQDMNFSRQTSGAEGLALLRELRTRRPELPVVLITAWGSIGLAVEGMKAGAADFLTKPWSNPALLSAVETALSLRRMGREVGPALDRTELERRWDLRGLVGEDPRFLQVLELVGRVAPTDASVLVTGESGTGKELVAEAIHRNSRRRNGPFVKVNLGGISPTLFESEMFGHVRGAFTDARADRRGRFEMAHGGTIFLDEVGEVEPAAQVKLLRVLQDRTYEVLGSSVTRTVDVRVVAATNRDLSELASRGQFREDLLYRLNLISVRLPALRERPLDVPRLARAFLDSAAEAHGRPPRRLTPAALGWLAGQRWPGNVRQLRQLMERVVLVLEAEQIDAADLAALADPAARQPAEAALPPPGSMTLDEMEKAMIAGALERYQGNLTRVAEALGLSRPALYRRLERHGLAGREGGG
jgi:two-component system NtrC family response regulator